jgi:hypothetical protein
VITCVTALDISLIAKANARELSGASRDQVVRVLEEICCLTSALDQKLAEQREAKIGRFRQVISGGHTPWESRSLKYHDSMPQLGEIRGKR